MSDWSKIELVAPKLSDPKDRKEMSKFISALMDANKDVFEVSSNVPNWATDQGTPIVYSSGTTRRLYVYIGDQWNYFGFMDSDGKIIVDGEIEIGTTLKADGTNGLWLGHTTFASAPFRVSLAGALVATSATITGAITAESGTIGGFTIGASALTAGAGASAVGMAPANYPFYAGNTTPASAPFYVTNEGVIKATSGTIGGWDLAATTLSSTNNKIILDDANELISVGDTGSTYIKIDGGNLRLESSDFSSGALGSGWRIGSNVAEFQNIRARGKITTAVFEKETISTVGGNLLVVSGDVLDSDMTALDASTLTITGDVTFAVNDILRMKDDTNDEWLKVTNIGSAPTYTVTRDQASDYAANTNPIWKKGTAVVNYGQSGTGGVFMTSSEANSPYIHFFTHAGSPWTTLTGKCRIGNLAGVAGCSGYGIWGGDGYLGALEVIDNIGISNQGTIRSNLSGNYPYLEFSNSGLMLKDSDTGGTYGTATYTTAGTYGYGALAWILNADLKIPWVELKEPNAGASDVASIRLYNRGDNPGGAAIVGDLAVVNGKLMICTGAGTPGTFTVVGAQTA